MYKEKLIELLKTDEEVKEQMERLEFGCLVKIECFDEETKKYGYFQRRITDIFKIKNEIEKVKIEGNDEWIDVWIDDEEDEDGALKMDLEIVGLPVQERFIRMYLNKKIIKGTWISDTGSIFLDNYGNAEIIATLDNTKDFDNQTEEVYQKIYEALNSLK